MPDQVSSLTATSQLSSQESSQSPKVIPASYIIVLIEKALQDQIPPKDPNLLTIFEQWKNEDKITNELDAQNKSKIIALLNHTFQTTYNLIRAKEQEAQVGVYPNQFDLSGLVHGSAFYRDIETKIKGANDPNIVAQVRKLMQNYVSYIGNISNLSDEQRHSALSQFPPKEIELYQCLGGTEGRLLNTRLGLNLSDTERLLYKIHSDIAEGYLPRFISHVALNIEAHTPFTLLVILGVKKELIKEIDHFHLAPISDIPIADAVEFLSTYEVKFNQVMDSLIGSINAFVISDNVVELSRLLKDYGINIDPLSHREEQSPTQFYKFSGDDFTSIEWLQNKDQFLRELQELKTEDPALPLVTIDPSKERAEQSREIMLQLFDPQLPKKLAQHILSNEKQRQTKAINILYFLGEDFVGRSSYQLLKSLTAIEDQDEATNPQSSEQRQISERALGKLRAIQQNPNHDFNSATQQKLATVIEKMAYEIQRSSSDFPTLSDFLASNMPLVELQEELIKHKESEQLRWGNPMNGAKALATNPNRKEILKFLGSFLPSHNILEKGMWQYATENRYPDFLKDLCEFSREDQSSILPFLLGTDDYGIPAIANMIVECPEGLSCIMPFLRELTDDEKQQLGRIVINQENLTLLHISCYHNRSEILKDLLSLNTEQRKFFDIDAKNNHGYTALICAVGMCFINIVKLLLENGAKVDEKDYKGFTALHLAVEKNQIDIVKKLLENGAKVDERNNDANTALHLATGKGHLEVIKLLLNQSAKVNAENLRKDTALHIAIQGDHIDNRIDIVKELLEKGANVNAPNVNLITPIHIAVKNYYPEILRLLLAEGAEVDKKDDKGFTALHLAVKLNSHDAIKLLLKQGAKVNTKDNQQSTPISNQLPVKLRMLLQNYQDAREEIFNITDENYLNDLNDLTAKIASFTEDDLSTAKTFNINGKAIELNAYGIINIIFEKKENHDMRLLNFRRSEEVSIFDKLSKDKNNFRLTDSILNLKQIIERKSSLKSSTLSSSPSSSSGSQLQRNQTSLGCVTQ